MPLIASIIYEGILFAFDLFLAYRHPCFITGFFSGLAGAMWLSVIYDYYIWKWDEAHADDEEEE